MDWRGKLIGGGIGFFLGGGPAGAAMGAAAGHWFVDRKKRREEAQFRKNLLHAAAGTFFELALADGDLRPAEENLAFALLSELNHRLGQIVAPSAIRSLPDFVAQNGNGHFGRQLTSLLAQRPEFAEHMFFLLLRIAAADANPGVRKTQYLIRRASELQLPQQTLDRLFTLYIRGFGSERESNRRDDAARLLEVSPDASPDALKRAFREKSLKYHPDLHADLAPEILALASEKFSQIQQAYKLLSGELPDEPSFSLPLDAHQFLTAEPGMNVRCILCGQAVRLPPQSKPLAARCPVCQCRLAFLRSELPAIAG